MSHTFAKKVQKWQRWILGSIVGIMAVTLVISFAPAWGGGDDREDKLAGRFFSIDVKEQEFKQQQRRALPWVRHEWINHSDIGAERILQFAMREGWSKIPERDYMGNPIRPAESEDVIRKKTWEMLILLHHAKQYGLRVSDDEIRTEAKSLLGYTQQEEGENKEGYKQLAEAIFACDLVTFLDMLRDSLLIEKLVEYELGGGVVRYSDVYRKILEGSKRARVLVAAIDPERFTRPENRRPISAEAVSKRFEQKKDEFQQPDRAQVEYLLADVDALKVSQPAPSEDDIKKYYEENKKGMFAKPHEHREGESPEAHEQQDIKPLDEVRGEIIDKIKARDAKKAAYAAIEKADIEIGKLIDAKRKELKAAVTAEMPGKPPAEIERVVSERYRAATKEWFDQIKQTLKRQGVELAHDISPLVDRNRIEDAYKTFGKPVRPEGQRDLPTFFFGRKQGDIDNGRVETEKGFALFRLHRKEDAYNPGLTEPIRQRLEKELALDDAQKRTQLLASTITQEILGKNLPLSDEKLFNPLTAVRRAADKHNISFTQSAYFDSRLGGGFGLGDANLEGHVRRQVFGGGAQGLPATIAGIGKTFAIDGSQLGADKKLWSYVCVVEDVITVAPDNPDSEFDRERRAMERDQARTERAKRIRDLVDAASFKEAKDIGKDTPEEPPTAP